MSRVDRTEDGRYIVVDGRRWRATDPNIPDRLREELVAELMSARRAVGVAKRESNDESVSRARARVADAKLALGERGHPWWEVPTTETGRVRAGAVLRALLRRRGPDGFVQTDEISEVLGSADVSGVIAQMAEELVEGGVIAQFSTGPRGSIQEFRRGPAFPD